WALLSGLSKISDSTPFWLGLPYVFWGYVIFAVALVMVLHKAYHSKWVIEKVFFAAGLLAFAAFLFLTRMHERYLEQAVPFLLLAGVKHRVVLWIFVAVSIFHTLNLYHNWWVPKIDFLVSALSQPIAVSVLSLATLAAFFVLLIQYLRGTK
ncbi:unnamed protein product, partial [marine sediment metagenome]